jgi:hypothetical protein
VGGRLPTAKLLGDTVASARFEELSWRFAAVLVVLMTLTVPAVLVA